MEAFVALGKCWSCGKPFTFDPDLVPSIPIDPGTNLPPDLGGDPAEAVKQPLCEDCVQLGNEQRAANGQPLIYIPAGAYL